MSTNEQEIPLKTIARIFKELSFKSSNTRITLSTLELSSEYIKLFINEAIIRANEERLDEGDSLVKIDGIDNVTQYPNIEEDQEEVNVEDIEDFDEDDYYDEITNSQRQLKKLENNTTGGNNRLDSRHLQKIAGVLTLDF
ncbi:predicted protein [Candida tropicalis MYA-3404]|uniref:Uncharacterized protein n=1 Tax=Candida tropicalis (strain ATCC MYA-3404 / T1) TaxID=294747 RepID=C5MID8_CANTT|nr:predicted protein [Candida tropicalis MYA-3404]EER30432.1 predicted protein [Candida tropicalis MYA-3404]KAG4406294.1 hypothetical protein JTP64_003678 [Candida tropicalis]MCP8716310.1 CENP-X/MHF2 family protein [Asgard group archaeon]